MERLVKFRDRYEVTADDLNNVELWSQESTDHVVADAIEGGRRFVGFNVVGKSTTEVEVSAGRIYFDGKRYFRDGVATLDLNSLRPATQKRIVAIVAWPETIDTDIQERDYEIDAETQTYEPRPVPMESRRNARLEAVGGSEGVSPQPPVLDTSVVVVAYVQMSAAGIETITRNEDAVLRNASDTADKVAALEAFRDEVEPQVSTLKTDMAKLSAQTGDITDRKLLFDTVSDMAIVKAALELPDAYVGYRANRFLDESQSDTAAAGYAARIEEGLRFPLAAQKEQALALANPYTPAVKVSGGSLVLPSFTRLERRITKGMGGEVALAQYAYEARTLVRLEMSRTRARFGADFEVSTNSTFWQTGTYQERLNGGTRSVFSRNGENFNAYDTGKVDADGHKIIRLSKFWEDNVYAPYWARLTTNEVVTGYAHVETYLNPQDRWVTHLGPHITRKPATGSITVGICETFRGEPDMDRVLAMTTVQAADVQTVGAASAEFPLQIPVEPTFLEGGKRYGYFIITAGDFWMGVADDLNPHTGAYFYGTNGGVWETQPGAHLIWRDWSAHFPTSQVHVDLQPMDLTGGIQLVDILADAVIPASCDLVWSVQIGGVWRAFDPADPDILDSLPPLLPMRVTFVGTPDVMPGLKLNNSRVRYGRLATAAKHVSKAKALPANTSKVVVKSRLRNFDPAHHGVTVTVKRADGTVETADTVVDTTMPDGVVEREATFNLAAATNGFTTITDMTTDAATRPFTVAEQIEIA